MTQPLGEGTLNWGAEYLLVHPAFYRVIYSINSYMDPARPVNNELACQQWNMLKETLEGLGATVSVLQHPPIDSPDMIYAMNLGYAVKNDAGDRELLLSSMAFPERQGERPTTLYYFEPRGYIIEKLPDESDHWEAGDAFPLGNDLIIVGVGPRTTLENAQKVAQWTGRTLIPIKILDARAYHLDLSFCPLPNGNAIIYKEAWDHESWNRLKPHLNSYLELTAEEALDHFSANSIVVGKTILVPLKTNERVMLWLEARGLSVIRVDVSEFELGGGSLRCMVNSLDFPPRRTPNLI